MVICFDTWKMLSKFRIGTKKNRRIQSFYRPNAEWSAMRTKMERSSTFVHCKGHSQGVAINPNLFSLKQTPLNPKEHIFHTGSSANYKSIPESGLWAGG